MEVAGSIPAAPIRFWPLHTRGLLRFTAQDHGRSRWPCGELMVKFRSPAGLPDGPSSMCEAASDMTSSPPTRLRDSCFFTGPVSIDFEQSGESDEKGHRLKRRRACGPTTDRGKEMNE